MGSSLFGSTFGMLDLHHPKKGFLHTQWLILGFALLTLGGVTGFDLYVDRGRVESLEQHRLLNQTRVIEENLLQNLTAVSRVLEDLRKEAPLNKANPKLPDRLKMLGTAMPSVRTLSVLDGAGTVLASNRPAPEGKSLSYPDYFRIPRDSPDPDRLFVSAPFKDTLGIYGINVARTVRGPKGEFAGIIAATLDPEYFRILATSVLYAPDMWAGVAHGDGIQFLMVPERKGQTGKNLAQPGSFFTRHRDSGKEAGVLTDIACITGKECMVALRSIQPARLKLDKPLVIAVGRDLSAVYAAWLHDCRVKGGLFFLIVLGSTLGLHVHQRRQRELALKNAEVIEAREAGEHLMRMVTDNIPGMVAYWTRELRCRFANRAYFEWFGRTAEQMQDIRIQDLMGDELFRRNEPFISATLRGERQDFERTLTNADGSIAHTWTHYIPDPGPDEVQGFFVLISDITEIKRAQIALAASEWKLKTIIETEPECVKVLAADGTLLQMNRAGLDLVEAESDSQVIGHQLTGLVTPEYREAFSDLNARVMRGESGTLEFEIVGLKGGHRWLDTHAVPMRDINGQVTGLLGVTRDITARKKVEQALEQLSQTDFLTNLVNRRHFMTLAEQELSRTVRYGGSLSVLMIDIDHFKNVNDTYGHETGDLVLQRFAELVRQTLRDIDVIGRIGGEEFAVVLPQTDGEHALEVANRLRKSIGDAEVVLDRGLPLHFTISIGVATLGGTGINIDTLLSQADQALYKAKQAGRNRVCANERQGR